MFVKKTFYYGIILLSSNEFRLNIFGLSFKGSSASKSSLAFQTISSIYSFIKHIIKQRLDSYFDSFWRIILFKLPLFIDFLNILQNMFAFICFLANILVFYILLFLLDKRFDGRSIKKNAG